MVIGTGQNGTWIFADTVNSALATRTSKIWLKVLEERVALKASGMDVLVMLIPRWWTCAN